MRMLLDLAPVGGGGAGVIAAVAFLLVFLGIAFVVFKLLKRTVKMAFRMVIVAIILAIAVAGSIALWALSSGGSSERPRPARNR